MPPIRIILVDDSPEFLQAAGNFLDSDPCVQVVGRFQRAEEALEQAPKLTPDLVLMDLALPGLNGLEATRRLKQASNPPQVIILTMYDLDVYRSAAPEVQADGFVTKSEFGTCLMPLIRKLFNIEEPAGVQDFTC
jgi:DNA-binding NarL/FixJ family response regulator